MQQSSQAAAPELFSPPVPQVYAPAPPGLVQLFAHAHFFLSLHAAERQSPATAQPSPGAHSLPAWPPQSTSVSAPFWMPSS